MDRLVVPAPEVPVLRLPWPDEARLTLAAPPPLRLVLPADLIPRVPGVAAGTVVGMAAVAGVVLRVIASASGGVAGDGYVVEATASASVTAAGAVAGAATVSGTALVPAAGTVAGAGTITGRAVTVLAGAISAAGTVSGKAVATLAGVVAAAGTVSGTAKAAAKASGAVAGGASVTGTAVRGFSPQGAYLSANQTIGGYSSAFFSPLAPLPAYPGSVASGSTLTVVGGGPATIVGTFASIGAWQAINLYRNGTKIVSGAASTSPISWPGSLAAGDQIQLEVVYSNGGSLPVAAGTTNVTLTITPA